MRFALVIVLYVAGFELVASCSECIVQPVQLLAAGPAVGEELLIRWLNVSLVVIHKERLNTMGTEGGVVSAIKRPHRNRLNLRIMAAFEVSS